MKNYGVLIIGVILMLSLIVLVPLILAVPTGGSVTELNSTTVPNDTSEQNESIAGNVTELNVTGFSATEFTIDEDEKEEREEYIIKIKLEAEEGNKIGWEAEGHSAKGFKVVWSKNKSPVYPIRDGDEYHYFSDSEKDSDELKAFDGEGIYYARVCEYLGSECGVYSNQIEIFLSDLEDEKEDKHDEKREKEKGYKHAKWVCFDDRHKEKKADADFCEPLDYWKTKAHDGCKDKCNEEEDKCGVFSFSVSGKCSLERDYDNDEDEKDEREEEDDNGEISIICNGCELDNKCYSFGYRKSGEYCSDSLEFTNQSKEESACDNNFECQSNLCLDQECVSGGLIKKILNWFRGFFGKG